jgi:hypothetical protein
MCDELQRMRDDCKSGHTTLDSERAADQREVCETYKRTLDTLPLHAYPHVPTAGSGR